MIQNTIKQQWTALITINIEAECLHCLGFPGIKWHTVETQVHAWATHVLKQDTAWRPPLKPAWMKTLNWSDWSSIFNHLPCLIGWAVLVNCLINSSTWSIKSNNQLTDLLLPTPHSHKQTKHPMHGIHRLFPCACGLNDELDLCHCWANGLYRNRSLVCGLPAFFQNK